MSRSRRRRYSVGREIDVAIIEKAPLRNILLNITEIHHGRGLIQSLLRHKSKQFCALMKMPNVHDGVESGERFLIFSESRVKERNNSSTDREYGTCHLRLSVQSGLGAGLKTMR